VELALGTDSGGSIRIPAAWCGIVGFKPTYGLVPIGGCFPLAVSYDHVGPMASSVEGCVALLQALAPEFEPASLDSLADLRVGVAWLDEAEPAIRDAVTAAAAHFDRTDTVELPFPDRDENALFMREVADAHEALYPEHADDYGASIRWKLERCLEVTDREVAAAVRLRDDYRSRCDELLDAFDLLVTPTVALAPPPADVDEGELRGRTIRLTYPFNALGRPALALPCGPQPASLQLVGKQGDDALVLAAGALLASLV